MNIFLISETSIGSECHRIVYGIWIYQFDTIQNSWSLAYWITIIYGLWSTFVRPLQYTLHHICFWTIWSLIADIGNKRQSGYWLLINPDAKLLLYIIRVIISIFYSLKIKFIWKSSYWSLFNEIPKWDEKFHLKKKRLNKNVFSFSFICFRFVWCMEWYFCVSIEYNNKMRDPGHIVFVHCTYRWSMSKMQINYVVNSQTKSLLELETCVKCIVS